MTRIDRRTLGSLAIGGSAALATMTLPCTTWATAARQQGGTLTGLGLHASAWEDTYGQGEQVDAAWDLWGYANPFADDAPVYVVFTDAIVTHVEMDFEARDGGISGKDATTFLMGIVPGDSEFVGGYAVDPPAPERVGYRYQLTASDALSRSTGGSGLVLVGYQEVTPMGPGGTRVLRVTATVEAGAGPAGSWGQPGGLGMRRRDFEEAWGEGEATQGPMLYRGDAVGGGDMYVSLAPGSGPVRAIRVTWGDDLLTDGTDGESAAEQLAGTLPADASRTGAFLLPPTPDGPIALMVEHWQSDDLGDAFDGADTALSVTWVGPESTGDVLIVPRLDMVVEGD